MKDQGAPGEGVSLEVKYNNITNLINLVNSLGRPSYSAFAIAYVRIGWSVFPCDVTKAPIVDSELNFVHGFQSATGDVKLTAKAWHKYKDAGIGLALPEGLIVFDCDVLKDADKKPILKDGKPDMIGLRSFQKLILELNFTDSDLDTLSVITQSGGRHIYYKMPDGIPSFNCTHALEGLDIKGFGGYVLLPNSPGQYGKYEFLKLTEIRDIPESLLKWILQFKDSGTREIKIPDSQDITDEQVKELISELGPVWIKASGKRWKLGKAISGALYREGWSLERADFVMQRLCDMIPNGREHRQIAKWVYAKMKDGNYKIEGYTTMKALIDKLENEHDGH